MNPVRALFKVIGVIWLVAILVIGIGGTYLERNPDAAAAFALGTTNVDPKAGVFKQAGQLAQGVAAAREGLEEMREASEQSRYGRGSAEARRKYAEARAAGYGHEAAARSAGMVVDSPESITIQ
jgi:hypothetical protein